MRTPCYGQVPGRDELRCIQRQVTLTTTPMTTSSAMSAIPGSAPSLPAPQIAGPVYIMVWMRSVGSEGEYELAQGGKPVLEMEMEIKRKKGMGSDGKTPSCNGILIAKTRWVLLPSKTPPPSPPRSPSPSSPVFSPLPYPSSNPPFPAFPPPTYTTPLSPSWPLSDVPSSQPTPLPFLVATFINSLNLPSNRLLSVLNLSTFVPRRVCTLRLQSWLKSVCVPVWAWVVKESREGGSGS